MDGAPHDCWVVESDLGDLNIPAPQNSQMQTKMTGGRMTYWIDQKLNLTLQMDFTVNLQVASLPPSSLHTTTVKKDLKIDQPVADSLFTFTPPADAKEVKEISLFRGPLPKGDLAGKDAPFFEVKDLDGKAYSLHSLTGC